MGVQQREAKMAAAAVVVSVIQKTKF